MFNCPFCKYKAKSNKIISHMKKEHPSEFLLDMILYKNIEVKKPKIINCKLIKKSEVNLNKSRVKTIKLIKKGENLKN